MAITKQDSIFPNIHLPGGISSKATEYKELATKGNTWESPIFKLGSASTSNDIAAAPKVTRKEHEVTEGGIRGPQNVGNTQPISNQLNDPAAQSQGQAANFGTQVDSAFKESSGLNGSTLNGSSNGAVKSTNGVANGKFTTQLGENNPVLTGTV